jgi:hypothetical protein
MLLLAALLPCRLAVSQSAHAPVPPLLPETSMRPTVTTTTLGNAAGLRYQYQLVHLESNCIWLAPAWRGQTKLEPARKFINYNFQGELDGLLMNTINELSADGWEFLEIRTAVRPVEATQKIEKDSRSTDPNSPVYTATTSFSTSSETRYLFRKALVH